jgi:hypothetical protein
MFEGCKTPEKGETCSEKEWEWEMKRKRVREREERVYVFSCDFIRN